MFWEAVWAEGTGWIEEVKALGTGCMRGIHSGREQEEEQSKEEARKKLMENQRRER
ncbi:hypothetical protein SAMN05216333_1581 [Nitrosomonas oligotropha]|uniref:Uncharacterized protein n=1 Tax=Nitrosomonas oligotropha TaxID=42354 RepID=A0A1H8VHV3_9PROT|nr:hypothetical protein SAMN05216333_1581 [Nitrosomonas oligotropha]